VLTAILAALGAALVFGMSSVAEQRSTKRVQSRRAGSPRILLDLVRQPLWVAAVGGTLLGFTLQVVALGFGPLALVQPILVFDLIFATLINAYLRRVWDRQILLGVVACAAGIGGFLAIARPSGGHTDVGFLVILPLAAGLAGGVGGCLAVAKRSQTLRPLALALATGINYGVAAFLVKIVVGRGFPGLLTDWPIYALAIVGPVGFILNQDAFQSGALVAPVLSIITACDPIISIALATVWLDESLNSTPLGIAGEVIALSLMVTGITVIAHRAPHVAPARPRPTRHESAHGQRASWTGRG
jgi:drug/metabolite transporter (DMT)-like permease